MSWVSGLVWVIQQGICSTWNIAVAPVVEGEDVVPLLSQQFGHERRKGSGGCRRPGARTSGNRWTRPLQAAGGAGLEAPHFKAEFAQGVAERGEAASPIRPPPGSASPTCSRPRMKVPAVMMTDRAFHPQAEVGLDARRPRPRRPGCARRCPDGGRGWACARRIGLHAELVGLLVALGARGDRTLGPLLAR